MNFELKSYHIYIGLVVFSLLTLIGVINEVGWFAILQRSMLWTIAITLLVVIIDGVLRSILFPPTEGELNNDFQETQGSQGLNIVLPEEDSLIQKNQSGIMQAKSSLDVSDAASNTEGKVNAGEDANFKPFVPQQIDPDVEKIIRADPEKAAEIVRKMGLQD